MTVASRGNAPATRRRRGSSLVDKAVARSGDTGPSLATGIARSRTAVALKPTEKNARRARSPESGQPGLWRRCRTIALTHTWTIPTVPVLFLLALYAVNPHESNPISHFIFLSYRIDSGSMLPSASKGQEQRARYGKGPWDFAFVVFYTLVLSFTREFVMVEILQPFARSRSQIRSRAKQMRFMEQMYTAFYFGIMGPIGLWVMYGTPVWYFNTRGMYEGFPHRVHTGDFKFYYLFQAAYWTQQSVVMLLGMEERRKDFRELACHHIVTMSSIGLSYRFHFAFIGIAVYVTHDVSDFFLALSKSLHYLDHDAIVPAFATSVISWMTVGPYVLDWETQQYKCWISNIIVFALIAALQALNLFWLYFLLRSSYQFIVYNTKKDDRSETEDSEDEPDEQERRLEPKARVADFASDKLINDKTKLS